MHKPLKNQLLLVLGMALLVTAPIYLAINQRNNSHKPNPSQQSQYPNKLVVTRPEDKADHLPTLTKTITDETKIRHLYEDIFALPTPYPGRGSCPVDFFARYTLDFYKDDANILHAVYDPTGCRSIQLGDKKTRVDQGNTIESDLTQILGLYGKD